MLVQSTRPARHVAMITLNRPGKRNAVDGSLARELISSVAEVEADPEIHVGILAASDPVFCAGADVRALSGADQSDIFNFECGFAGFTNSTRIKSWIAAVDGPAIGGGFELALACDVIVASEAGWFSLPEVRHGALALGGGIERLAQALPHPVARGLILSGGRLSAARAYQLGLVTALAPPGETVSAALALADEIAALPVAAVRESLALSKIAGPADFVAEAKAALARLSSKGA